MIEDSLSNISDKAQIAENIQSFAQLIHFEIPMQDRPMLFAKLNDLMSNLMMSFSDDKDIYNLAFFVTTLFKNQIDKAEQASNEMNNLEWAELEKSIYLMSDWEVLSGQNKK